jgi:hypothetical protein
MIDVKNSQSFESAEFESGTFPHFSWSVSDEILVEIADHRVPLATATNQVSALLQTLNRAWNPWAFDRWCTFVGVSTRNPILATRFESHRGLRD